MVRELYPTPSDTFLDVGWLGGTNLNDEHNMLEIIDEQGILLDWKSSGKVFNLTSKLKQSGIDEINLVRNADGKYYEMYYKVTTGEAKVQEINAFVKIQPGAQIEFAAGTERTIPITIKGWAVKAALVRSPTVYNIAVYESYVYIENAAAQGVPIDTAATVATAVL